MFTRYTYHDSDINGFGLVNINTATSLLQKQVIRFESNLRGFIQGKTFDDWIDIAHKKQLHIFDLCFKEGLRDLWK